MDDHSITHLRVHNAYQIFQNLLMPPARSAHAGCPVPRGAVGCVRTQARAPTYSVDHPSSPRRSIMSTVPSTSIVPSMPTSHSNFPSIFNAALESYKRKTKKDLAKHPLLPSFQSCNSAEDIITVLREQVPVSSESQDHGLTKWVAPTVNVIYSFSATIGQGVGLVISRHSSK